MKFIEPSTSLPFSIGLVIVLLIGTPSAQAQGGSTVQGDCAPFVDTIDKLKFDDANHKAWYRRFWTGSCSGVSGFCLSGSPNWAETVHRIQTKDGPPRSLSLTSKACRLGQKIGLEWARDNSVRRIDTDELRHLSEQLFGSADILAGLYNVNARVDQLLSH